MPSPRARASGRQAAWAIAGVFAGGSPVALAARAARMALADEWTRLRRRA
jgi:hypothetical protein